MIVTLDIETIGNADAVAKMPDPKPNGRLNKDPDKIARDVAEKKAAMITKAALDPLTAQVAAFALVGIKDGAEHEYVEVIEQSTICHERDLLQKIFATLGYDGIRIVTWNGIGFDLPMIYKRAMILGVDPGNFGAPPLSAWTTRYRTDRHYDLMQIWGGWRDFAKLDTVASIVLGQNKTEGFDVSTIAALIEQGTEGRAKVAEYCLQDTRLTWELWKRFSGFMFA